MKIFAVYARLNLIKKPEWLDKFREKYDDLYDFHITLKQPCFIDEKQIPELKNTVSEFFDNLVLSKHEISVLLNKTVIEEYADNKGEYIIMISTNEKSEIYELQAKILSALSDYTNYVKPKYKDYEKSFEPHITIARHLDTEKLAKAKEGVVGDYTCCALIQEIVLAIVPEDTVEESKNPQNLTVYKL